MTIPCKLFHVSPTRFEKPRLEPALNFLLDRGEKLNKSPNGSMGIWVSPYPSSCRAFGPEVAALELSSDTRYAVMALNQLYKLYVQANDWPYKEQVLAHQRLGRALAERCDVLLIGDAHREAGEIIVLNTHVITKWEWLENYDFSTDTESVGLDEIKIDTAFSRELRSWQLTDATAR